MKIIMTKRKPGIYAQWFTIDGLNKNGNFCTYLIYWDQAKTYAQAIRFWNKQWGQYGDKAFILRNSDPFNENSFLAC